MDSVEDVFGWIATCLTMCFYISPVIPFINVFKGKITYEDTPGVLITASYVNCFCWYIYGDMIFSDQVKICNGIGAVSSLCLIFIYLAYEIRKYTLDAILNALIILTGSYAVYRGLTIVVDDDAVVGKICNVTAIIVFLSPILIIYRVLKEKYNYYLIPIYTALVSLFSTSCWVVYGIMISDVYIMIPNIIGIILAIIQIVVFTICKKKYPTIPSKERETSAIDIDNSIYDRKEPSNMNNEDIQNISKEKPVTIS